MAAHARALNLAADAIAGAIVEVSLHSGAPGTEGTANELSGGGYDRVAADWSAASGGTAALSGTFQFSGPASSSADNAQYIGFWNSGGLFLGSAQLSAPKTIGPGDTLTITAAPITVAAA